MTALRDGAAVRGGRLDGRGRSTSNGAVAPGIELVVARPLISGPVVAQIELAPGDRALVAAGEAVVAGTPLAERLRDAVLADAPVLPGDDPRRPGDRLASDHGAGRSLRRAAAAAGELVFRSGRRWRVATGEMADPIEAPAAGIVREVRAGTAIAVELAGATIAGVFAIGTPTRGRIAVAAETAGELHGPGLDVGRAGTILVVGARIDAEMLTRARAMGVRGVVVAGLSGKDVRDFAASERRQRAALHRLPSFAVLVLDGVLRRPIASPVLDLFSALAGREVGIVTDPPALVIPGDPPPTPVVDPAWVRIRHGALAGREGRWGGALGPRRFGSGVHLEAGLVAFDDGTAAVIPLADLERSG